MASFLMMDIHLNGFLIPIRSSMILSAIFITVFNYFLCLAKFHILFSFIHAFGCFQRKTHRNQTTKVKMVLVEPNKCFVKHF